MIELFQITGSTSFVARAALEEIGVPYTTVNVHPRRRDETPELARLNPLQLVPVLRDGDVTVYETSAVLQYLAERFPQAGLAPPVGSPVRGEYLRWLAWLGNTLHGAWRSLTFPAALTDDEAGYGGIRARGLEELGEIGEYLESELAGRPWCCGDRYTVADIYLYMLKGWESYADGFVLGGPHLAAHFARVGARPAIARTRELDDLDERFQRHHPALRAGLQVFEP